MREYKTVKAAVMGIDDRSVTGIFAVHGNTDDGDGWSTRDRSHPGMFGDFTVDGRSRVVFLWQHNSYDPPIATIDRLFDVSAAELPPAVKLYAPDATGGTAVTRTYLDTPRGNEVLSALKAGAITEMSYAYEPTRWDYEKQDEGSRDLPIRNLYEANLYDVSDVNHGMNPATSADGSKDRPLVIHSDDIKAIVAAFVERARRLKEQREKAGRVFSAANYTALEGVAGSLEGLAIELRDLLSQAEPKQASDIRKLWLETQRTLAAMNGVRL
jgi:HK97 family phage prohead protease